MTILLCFCCDAVRFSKNISTKVLFYFFQSLHVKVPSIVCEYGHCKVCNMKHSPQAPSLTCHLPILFIHKYCVLSPSPPPLTHPNPVHSYAPTFISHFIPSQFTPRSVTIDCILNLEKISLRYHNKMRYHFYWRA